MLVDLYKQDKERQDFVLDNITQLIKTEIKKQYKSVRKFSEKSGIPYSTLSNALYKGIGATSQKGQYDFYRKISVNDIVVFTDVEGNRYTYTVTNLQYESHADQTILNR